MFNKIVDAAKAAADAVTQTTREAIDGVLENEIVKKAADVAVSVGTTAVSVASDGIDVASAAVKAGAEVVREKMKDQGDDKV